MMIFVLLVICILFTFLTGISIVYMDKKASKEQIIINLKNNNLTKILVFAFYFVAFIYAYSLYELKVDFWAFSILMMAFIVSAFEDLKYNIIEDEVSVITIFLGVIYAIVKGIGVTNVLGGFLIGGGVLFIIALLTGGGMGGADIKLMAAYGVFLGIKLTLLALLLAFITGALIGLLLLIFRLKKRKDTLAFSPYLSIGALVSFLYGNAIIEAYIKTLVR